MVSKYLPLIGALLIQVITGDPSSSNGAKFTEDKYLLGTKTPMNHEEDFSFKGKSENGKSMFNNEGKDEDIIWDLISQVAGKTFFKNGHDEMNNENINLGMDINGCMRFLFAMEELPHILAKVSDTLLNATKLAIPLAQKMFVCTKGDFKNIISCFEMMKGDLREFYVSMQPLFGPPIVALTDHIVKTKAELESCLDVKKRNKNLF